MIKTREDVYIEAIKCTFTIAEQRANLESKEIHKRVMELLDKYEEGREEESDE